MDAPRSAVPVASGILMSDVIGLVVPFFGLILIGFLAARITRQPLEARPHMFRSSNR